MWFELNLRFEKRGHMYYCIYNAKAIGYRNNLYKRVEHMGKKCCFCFQNICDVRLLPVVDSMK